MSGTFELRRTANGDFTFRLVSGQGQIIVSSANYKARASARNGIASVRKNALESGRYERRISTAGRHYFILKARNGEPIAQSPMLASVQDVQAAIDLLKQTVTEADVADVSL